MMFADRIRSRIPPRIKERWPQIRAVLVTFHVLSVLVLSFPSPPPGMKRSSWKHPTVQNEFRQWVDRLGAVGVETSVKELEDTLWPLSTFYLGLRSKVTMPFAPYAAYSGSQQSWRMFVAPQRYPIRLEISIREGKKPYRLIYASRSEEHTWLAHTLERYRMRRVVLLVSWEPASRDFKRLCDWIAKQAARDFPNATHVQIRQLRYRTPTPEEALAGKTILEPKYLSREVRSLRDPK